MGCCKRCCCCLCCPCCFLLGTFRALALLGAFLALLAALALGPAPLDLGDDVADLCEAAAWFRDTELSYTVASTENLERWAMGCREAFVSLAPEAQRLLRTLREEGRHRDAEMLRAFGIEERTALWKHKTNAAIANGTLKEAPMPPMVELSEIREAFREAKVVRFDATKLLPKQMFNSTLQLVNDMHPESINETILYGTWGGGGMCRMLLLMQVSQLYPRLGRTLLFSALRNSFMFLQRICPLKPVPWWLANPEKLRALSTTNINLKRLPHFDGRLNVPAQLGLEKEVAGMLGLLWMGQISPETAKGAWHTDVQDNILMELTSETVVIIAPRKLFYGRPDDEEVTGTYHKVHLHPGQGIVIPSNFLHSVYHLHEDRFGVNYFFEPQFGQMQWANSSGNFYVEEAKERKEHLAMRVLWFKSANIVWDRYKTGLSFHGWKMEVL